MARRRDPLLERAALDTSLRTRPQENALRSLLSELAGSYSRSRKVNESNSAGIVEATRQARPEVEGAFTQALASVNAQRAALGGGGALDPQAAAFERRIGEQRAGAVNDLTDRSTRAVEGRVFANQTARQEYMGGKQKILGQMLELSGEAGAQTASTLGKLREDQAQRGIQRRGQDVTARGQDVSANNAAAGRLQSERNSERSSGIDPDTGLPIPGGRRDPKAKGPKLATREAHAGAKDQIDGARRWIQRLSQGQATSPQIRDLLEAGGTIEVGGTPMKVPRFSKDFVNAAYDLQHLDGLSPANVKALHRRGLKIGALGYPTVARKKLPAARLGGAIADLGVAVQNIQPVVVK